MAAALLWETLHSLLILLVLCPLAFLWGCLASLSQLFTFPALVACTSLALQTLTFSAFPAQALSWALFMLSLLSVLLQLGLWLQGARKFAGAHRSSKALPPALPLLLALPPSFLALALWVSATGPAALAAACFLAPLATALAVTRLWACTPSLRVGLEREASLLRRALQGSGVTFTQATSCGMHIVEFSTEARGTALKQLTPVIFLHGVRALSPPSAPLSSFPFPPLPPPPLLLPLLPPARSTPAAQRSSFSSLHRLRSGTMAPYSRWTGGAAA